MKAFAQKHYHLPDVNCYGTATVRQLYLSWIVVAYRVTQKVSHYQESSLNLSNNHQ